MHAPQSQQAQRAREGAQQADPMRYAAPGSLVPTGRNPQMVKWGDHVEKIGTAYIDQAVAPALSELASYVAQEQNPEAQAAMVRLGIYVHRVPQVAATAIRQEPDHHNIHRLVDPDQTNELLNALNNALGFRVPEPLTAPIRQALSPNALTIHVARPAAEAANFQPED